MATQTSSPHQLTYFARQLTRRAAADSMDRMASALLDAQVDLNPHQIDAALFATSNPLSKGGTLAEKLETQKVNRDLENQRDRKRRELFQRQDEIQSKRDNLIDELEKQLWQQVHTSTLFACEWEVA